VMIVPVGGVIMIMAVVMVVTAIMTMQREQVLSIGGSGQFIIAAGHPHVRVEMEPAHQEEGEDHSPQQPADAPVESEPPFVGNHIAMGQLVQDSNPQHQASDEADQELHPPVGQVEQRRDIAPQQRCQHDQQALDNEDTGRISAGCGGQAGKPRNQTLDQNRHQHIQEGRGSPRRPHVTLHRESN